METELKPTHISLPHSTVGLSASRPPTTLKFMLRSGSRHSNGASISPKDGWPRWERRWLSMREFWFRSNSHVRLNQERMTPMITDVAVIGLGKLGGTMA